MCPNNPSSSAEPDFRDSPTVGRGGAGLVANAEARPLLWFDEVVVRWWETPREAVPRSLSPFLRPRGILGASGCGQVVARRGGVRFFMMRVSGPPRGRGRRRELVGLMAVRDARADRTESYSVAKVS